MITYYNGGRQLRANKDRRTIIVSPEFRLFMANEAHQIPHSPSVLGVGGVVDVGRVDFALVA